jgi:hypothetical protein
MIDAQDSLHAAYDTAYGAANHGADRPGSLVAYSGTVGNTSRNSLGLGPANQGEREDKTNRQCVEFHIVQSSIVLVVARCERHDRGNKAF